MLFDVVSQIPAWIHITEAKVHDVNAMDGIPELSYVFYIFDKGYYDLGRLYTIYTIGSYYVIWQKSRLQYKIIDGEELLEGADNVVLEQTICLTGLSDQKEIPLSAEENSLLCSQP